MLAWPTDHVLELIERVEALCALSAGSGMKVFDLGMIIDGDGLFYLYIVICLHELTRYN
jgi:hypothetical protein